MSRLLAFLQLSATPAGNGVGVAAALVAVFMAALACGGGAEPNGDAPIASANDSSSSTPEATSGIVDEAPSPDVEIEGVPVRTITAAEVPDPCQLLTREDAAELLGEPVGPPRQPDAGAYPCVYWAESGDSQIVLDMSLTGGPSVDDTQLSLSLEHCEGERVAEVDDLGYRAALFRMRKENCGGDRFWVSTGIYFERTEPDEYAVRRSDGYIHFTFMLHPTPDDQILIDKLSTAAERALARLPR